MKKPFLFFWTIIGAAVLFSWIYLPALSRYQDLKTRQDGIDIQTKNLQAKLKDIREERDLLKNDQGYLEKVIREELGLVKPGEIVYKFVEEKPKPVPPPVDTSAAEGTLNPDEIPKPRPIVPPAAQAPAKPVETAGVTVPAKLVSPAPVVSPAAKPAAAPAPAVQTVRPAASPAPVYPRKETR